MILSTARSDWLNAVCAMIIIGIFFTWFGAMVIHGATAKWSHMVPGVIRFANTCATLGGKNNMQTTWEDLIIIKFYYIIRVSLYV